MIRALIAMLLVGCASEPAGNGDITGPFTGPSHRYVVDRIDLPMTQRLSREMAVDLDGNRLPDNQLGSVVVNLEAAGLVTPHGPDMIAAGAIASSITVVADDLENDPTVSVTYHGADDDPATAVGGAFRDGHFMSNRTVVTKVTGDAIARLPVFFDAAPSALPITHLEIELQPDGLGGFDGFLRGAVDPATALDVAYQGLAQVMAVAPGKHRFVRALFDTNPADWTITKEEFTASSLVESLFAPDITLDGSALLSFAFAVHLVPCESGDCSSAAPDDTCVDRVRDGDEVDVDCGGSCRRCRAGDACTAAADCESQICDAGTCGAPRCDDGVRDGWETDVDCGGNCADCTIGARCWDGGDCASGQCGMPCTDPDPFGCVDTDPSHDVCYPAP